VRAHISPVATSRRVATLATTRTTTTPLLNNNDDTPRRRRRSSTRSLIVRPLAASQQDDASTTTTTTTTTKKPKDKKGKTWKEDRKPTGELLSGLWGELKVSTTPLREDTTPEAIALLATLEASKSRPLPGESWSSEQWKVQEDAASGVGDAVGKYWGAKWDILVVGRVALRSVRVRSNPRWFVGLPLPLPGDVRLVTLHMDHAGYLTPTPGGCCIRLVLHGDHTVVSLNVFGAHSK
jgi:hypothetical protein